MDLIQKFKDLLKSLIARDSEYSDYTAVIAMFRIFIEHSNYDAMKSLINDFINQEKEKVVVVNKKIVHP